MKKPELGEGSGNHICASEVSHLIYLRKIMILRHLVFASP